MERADHDFKAGDYDRAKIEYLNVLKLDRTNRAAIRQLGVIYLEGGAPVRAFPFLKAARDLNPHDFEISAKLASALLALGEIAEARKQAVAVLQQSPNNTDAILVLADSIRSKEEMDEVEQQLGHFGIPESAPLHLAWATLALRKSDPVTAEKELRQAVALEPKSAIAHLAMANFRTLQKDLKEAGPEFKMAAELAPVRSIERIKYAEFQAATGAADGARANLKEITRQAPDYLPAWLLGARISIGEKKFDEALSLLENIFSRDAENIDARLLQAQTEMAKGENVKAIEVLQALSKKYQNVPGIQFQLARAYLQNNDLNPAIAELKKAVGTQPEYIEAAVLLAQANLRAGDGQAVVASMVDLLKKHPALAPAQSLLAEAYRSLGRLDEAAAVLRDHIKAAPQNPDGYFMLGMVLRQQNLPGEARESFQKSLTLSPDNLLVIDQLVSLDLADKQVESASQRVAVQMAKTPKAPALHLMEAKIHIAQSDWDRAEAALKKALELDPNYGSAYELLISSYIAVNKLPQAISQLEVYLSKKPDDARALMTLAVTYEKQKEVQKARETYEKILGKNPEFVLALNNLAYLYADQLKDAEKAYELARKARQLAPGDANVADTLGWVLYKRGDYQQAQGLFQESAGKQAENSEIQFHLGMASYMMGQKERAQDAFQKALQGSAEFASKQEARRRLAVLNDAGSAQLSRDQLLAMLQEQSNDPIVRVRLAEAYEKENDFSKAAAEYEEALHVSPKLLSPWIKLAQFNAGPLQNNERALEYAKKARELAPADAQVAGVLGRIAFRARNFAWSHSLLQESARQLPDDPTVLHDYAWAAYSLGNVEQARDAMERVIHATPSPEIADDAKSFVSLTALDQNPKDAAAAEAEIDKLLQADPYYVPAMMVRASLQVRRGESKRAVGTYSEVLQRFPDFAPAQRQLAILYLENGETLDKAYDFAMKARKTLPKDPVLSRTLGEISYQRKEYPRAVQLLQESALASPLEARSLYYLGAAQMQIQQKPQGKATLERALSSGLQEPLASEAKRFLAEPKAE